MHICIDACESPNSCAERCPSRRHRPRSQRRRARASRSRHESRAEDMRSICWSCKGRRTRRAVTQPARRGARGFGQRRRLSQLLGEEARGPRALLSLPLSSSPLFFSSFVNLHFVPHFPAFFPLSSIPPCFPPSILPTLLLPSPPSFFASLSFPLSLPLRSLPTIIHQSTHPSTDLIHPFIHILLNVGKLRGGGKRGKVDWVSGQEGRRR